MRVYLVMMKKKIKVISDDELPQQWKGKGGEWVGGGCIGWKAELITVVSWNITALSCEAKHSRSTGQHFCLTGRSVLKVGTHQTRAFTVNGDRSARHTGRKFILGEVY